MRRARLLVELRDRDPDIALAIRDEGPPFRAAKSRISRSAIIFVKPSETSMV